MITDYHVHLETGPYSLDWLKKYLEVAQEQGITDLGFSEHGYRFKQSKEILYNPWIEKQQTENVEEYVNLVLKAKKQGLPVKLGVELDFVPGKEKKIENFIQSYPWDYVIGSIHWIEDWGFDLPEMKEKWDHGKVIDIYGSYFSIMKQLLASHLFDIIGHLDVIKVFGYKPEQKDYDILLSLYDQIIEPIKKSGAVVEMSTAGLRKPVRELYPSKELMEQLTANNIPMMINSDAHRPEDVGAGYEQGIAYLKKYGVKNIYTLHQRKKSMVPLG